MIEISSAQNEHFKRWKDLDSSRGIKKHQEFFLMGEKLIGEFLKSPQYNIKAEVISEGMESLTRGLNDNVSQKRIPLFKLSKSLFNEIDFMGTHFNLLVLEPKELEAFDPSLKLPDNAIQVLAPLGDPGNLGALVRSVVAFKAHSIVLTSESASPFLPKAIKGSAGAILKAKIFKSPSLPLKELIESLHNVVALDMNGTEITKYQSKKAIRLLIGEEGPGIPEKLKVERVKIATSGVESLNATVAASIALWELQKSRA